MHRLGLGFDTRTLIVKPNRSTFGPVVDLHHLVLKGVCHFLPEGLDLTFAKVLDHMV